MRRSVVVVVDDDKYTCELLDEALTEDGYTVQCYQSSAQAWAALMDYAVMPSLILLDQVMPSMDGIEFRRRQLLEPRLAAIPVMLITALTAQAIAAMSVPFDGIVQKPFDLQALLVIVNLYCP